MVSLVLYLCAGHADFGERPAARRGQEDRRGMKLFPRPAPIWEMGSRIGAALRAAQAGPAGRAEPHAAAADLRKAHWHGYRVGPRKQSGAQKPDLR